MTGRNEVGTVGFEIRRSRRKSLGLTIERDGQVIVRAPVEAEDCLIAKFVSDKQMWLHRKLAQRTVVVVSMKPEKQFVNGEGFLYLGRTYRLKIISGGAPRHGGGRTKGPALRLWHGYFELVEDKLSEARQCFVEWYRIRAKELTRERLARYDQRIGVSVRQLRVSDLGHRWASYGPKGTLNVNWRSVMAPVWVFDYMLVHELAHGIEHGHTPKFWELVSRVVPDYREHVTWLNENGAGLDL